MNTYTQVLSAEGGRVHTLDKWSQLHRFLILGSPGTYYTDAREDTKAAIGVIRSCLAENWTRTLQAIKEVSEGGRAQKNDHAVFALSLALRSQELETRRAASALFNTVCRTGTHMLSAAAFIKASSPAKNTGSGKLSNRLIRRTLSNWFLEQTTDQLALQAIKYPSRGDWSLRDVLRQVHPKIGGLAHRDNDEVMNAILHWIVKGEFPENAMGAHYLINARDSMHAPGMTPDVAANLIRSSGLPREALPTTLLNDVGVWDALLTSGKWGMPLTAMIRNLGKMTNVGLLNNERGNQAVQFVVKKLRDEQALIHARVHPISILAALMVYQQGHGERGSLAWTPVRAIVNALDEAFYLAFKVVTPSNARILLSLDCSSSMKNTSINEMPFLDPRTAAAAMALVVMNTETRADVIGFSDRIVDLPIFPTMRIDEVVRIMEKAPFGWTLAALPIIHATKTGTEYDAIISLTDSQTADVPSDPTKAIYFDPYSAKGPRVSVDDALSSYREKYSHPVRHAVVAMAGGDISINNPHDPYGLDVAGLDSAVPAILSDFAAGHFDPGA